MGGWYRQLSRIEGAKSTKARFTNAQNGTRRCITIPLKDVMNLGDDYSDVEMLPDPPFD